MRSRWRTKIEKKKRKTFSQLSNKTKSLVNDWLTRDNKRIALQQESSSSWFAIKSENSVRQILVQSTLFSTLCKLFSRLLRIWFNYLLTTRRLRVFPEHNDVRYLCLNAKSRSNHFIYFVLYLSLSLDIHSRKCEKLIILRPKTITTDE